MRHLFPATSAAMFLGSLTFISVAMAQTAGRPNMSGNSSVGTSSNSSAAMGAQGNVVAAPPATPPDADDNTNSNGKNAMDRDKGQARAEDRRNDRDADDRQANARKDADDPSAEAGKDADDRGSDRDNDDRSADKR